MTIRPYTDDQNDALQEVVNIAMGQAGDSLARILENFVELSIPRIRLVTVDDVVDTVTQMMSQNTEITAVRQAFASGLRGEAIVVFTQGDATDLAKLLDYDTELDDAAKQELIMEVSNLLVGSIVNGISETLAVDLTFSPPSLMADHAPIDKVLTTDNLSWSHAMLMEVNFTIENHDIKCHLLMFMTENAIDTLRSVLDRYLEAV